MRKIWNRYKPILKKNIYRGECPKERRRFNEPHCHLEVSDSDGQVWPWIWGKVNRGWLNEARHCSLQDFDLPVVGRITSGESRLDRRLQFVLTPEGWQQQAEEVGGVFSLFEFIGTWPEHWRSTPEWKCTSFLFSFCFCCLQLSSEKLS